MHALKYGDRLDLAPTMGRWMAHAGRELLAEADALVPVPLHWRRHGRGASTSRRARRRVSARRAACRSPRAALKRVKATAQQVGLSRTERATNVQGAFRVRAEGKAAVTGRRLVLVDDVLTSGRHRRRLRAGAVCAPAPPTSTCWCSPGLSTRCERPYKRHDTNVR